MPKPVRPRRAALQDVEAALAFYMTEGSAAAGLGFVDALEAAYARIARQPASGSPRWAHELNLPGLRAWPLKRYPYLVFYVEGDEVIDVWRVLHTRRDFAAWLAEPG